MYINSINKPAVRSEDSMKKYNTISGGVIGLTLGTLLILPGCGILDMITGKSNSSGSSSSVSKAVQDGTPVLLSVDGVPAITQKTFDEYFEQFVAANPRLQSMIQFMPNAKKEIFNGMVNERILLAWGEKNRIHENEDYQKELDQAMRMVKTGLAAKQFEKDLIGKVVVTDKEMQDYYDAHKDPELIVTQAGVKAVGVEFDSKEKAQAFFDKAKDAKDFKAAAADQKVKEFASINKQSFDVDKAVIEKVSAVTTFPKVIMVEAADKKFWVISAQSKQAAQYRSFDEIKDGLRQMIEREKAMKIYNDKIADLKKQYNVVEDTKSFDQAMPAGMPQMMMPEEADDHAGHSHETAAKSL